MSRLPVLHLILGATLVAVGCGESPSETSSSERVETEGVPPAQDSKSDDPEDPEPRDSTVEDDDETEPDTPPAPVYRLSETPYTTLQKRWAPAELTDETRRAIGTAQLSITELDRFEEMGVGVVLEEGQPWVEHNELARSFDGPRPGERRSLLYFWQSADPQLIDEESPIRWEATLVPKGSTYRPQGHLIPQVFESHVRTARRLSDLSGRPFEFAFVAGDLTDGGQENELGWATGVLAGGVIDPDSGIDDDPVAGPANDFTDPFYSHGIGAPWYVALGNHETLYMGTFGVTDAIREAAVGDRVLNFASTLPVVDGLPNLFNGFRDASTPYGDVVSEGTTPPDERRQILRLGEVLAKLQAAGGEPPGHGLTREDVEAGRGYYSFHPVPGKPIRFVVLNTVMERLDVANIQGGIDDEQFRWLESELAAADIADELVIVGSHHRTGAMSPVSDVSGRQLERLLADWENVVLHVVGHDHHSGKFLRRPLDDRRGYWELMCPSSVDFPLQSRVLEFVYEGDGYLSIYVTNVDHNATEDSLAHQARHFAVARKFFWDLDYRANWVENRGGDNVIVRVRLPDGVARNIEHHAWPDRVESEETLLEL